MNHTEGILEFKEEMPVVQTIQWLTLQAMSMQLLAFRMVRTTIPLEIPKKRKNRELFSSLTPTQQIQLNWNGWFNPVRWFHHEVSSIVILCTTEFVTSSCSKK